MSDPNPPNTADLAGRGIQVQSSLKTTLRKPLLPLVRWVESLGARPDQVTLAGLVASALAGAALAFGNLLLGLIWLLVALLCDLIDGDLARLRPERTSPYGAFLDSCADRVSEALVFGGLLIGMIYHEREAGFDGIGWSWVLAWVLALTGSFMVSYTRARAEGLGVACSIGLAERPERMILLILLLLFGFRASIWFLWALCLVSWVTVVQRVLHVLRRSGSAETREP